MFLWWKSDLINLPWHYFLFRYLKLVSFQFVHNQWQTSHVCTGWKWHSILKREEWNVWEAMWFSKISLQPRSANLILKVTPSDTERSLCVFLQPVPQMLHLCSDATLSCASRGAVLLHTAPVVPHWGHVTSKQRAEGTEQTMKRQR